MGQGVGHPELPDLVATFLFQQRNPGAIDIPDVSKCPKVVDPGYSFNSAVTTFYAPSDLSGVNGMHWQHIHASSLWRNGSPRYDCVCRKRPYSSRIPGIICGTGATILLLSLLKCILSLCFSAVVHSYWEWTLCKDRHVDS